MRLSCLGCLTLLIAGALVAGTAWCGLRMLQEPAPPLPAVPVTAADGVRAQQKIFEIIQRGAGRSKGNGEPVVLLERELSAFLSRHLAEAADVPFSDVELRLAGGGVAEFQGRLPLRHLLGEGPLSTLATAVPAAWLEGSVWLRLATRARIEPGAIRAQRRYLRLDVVEFAIGRQRLPAPLARFLLDPATLRALRWPVPDRVEAVTIEKGRAVIRIAS